MALRILPITAIKAEVAVLNACKNSQAKLPVKISEFIRRTSGVYEDLEKMFLPRRGKLSLRGIAAEIIWKSWKCKFLSFKL